MRSARIGLDRRSLPCHDIRVLPDLPQGAVISWNYYYYVAAVRLGRDGHDPTHPVRPMWSHIVNNVWFVQNLGGRWRGDTPSQRPWSATGAPRLRGYGADASL